MKKTDDSKILKPFSSLGKEVTSADIRKTINAMANVPEHFEAVSLTNFIYPAESDATHHDRQEAMNRFMQRLRKAGLATYKNKKWNINKAAWDRLQMAASNQFLEENKA